MGEPIPPNDARAIEDLASHVVRNPVSLKRLVYNRSAVSRRFVEEARRRFEKLPHRDLSKLDLAVLMIDGIHFEDLFS